MTPAIEFKMRRKELMKKAGPWLWIGLVGSLVCVEWMGRPTAPFGPMGMAAMAGGFTLCIVVGRAWFFGGTGARRADRFLAIATGFWWVQKNARLAACL